MTVAIGADIARFGKDLTGVAVVEDTKVIALDEWSNKDLMETSGRILKWIEDFKDSVLTVDDTGLGGGVVDRLREQGVEVLGINYGSRAYEFDRFRDKASEMWWRLRELHDPDSEEPISYSSHNPLVKRLMAQLSGAHYKFDSKGRIWVVKCLPGDESPGLGDALALAYEGWVTYWASHISVERRINNEIVFGHLKAV
jgi:hypothetical protein